MLGTILQFVVGGALLIFVVWLKLHHIQEGDLNALPSWNHILEDTSDFSSR